MKFFIYLALASSVIAQAQNFGADSIDQFVQDETVSKNSRCHRGPRGFRGKRGKTGPRGHKGHQGVRGHHGPIGPQGDTGPQGPRGPQRNSGPTGQTGPTGPTGIAPSIFVDASIVSNGTGMSPTDTPTDLTFTTVFENGISGSNPFIINTDGYYQITASLGAYNTSNSNSALIGRIFNNTSSTTLLNISLEIPSNLTQGTIPLFTTQEILAELHVGDSLSFQYSTIPTTGTTIFLGVPIVSSPDPLPSVGASFTIQRIGDL